MKMHGPKNKQTKKNKILCKCPDRPGAHTAFCKWVPSLFPGCEVDKACRWPPTPI